MKTEIIVRAKRQLTLFQPEIKDTLLEAIADAAANFFEDTPEDFCVHHVTYDTIVFGGTNRLIWSPHQGFRPDAEHCSKEFLLHWQRTITTHVLPVQRQHGIGCF